MPQRAPHPKVSRRTTRKVGCSPVFFQAEDGIRGIGVTGVQTCALPIFTFVTNLSRQHATELIERACQGNAALKERVVIVSGFRALRDHLNELVTEFNAGWAQSVQSFVEASTKPRSVEPIDAVCANEDSDEKEDAQNGSDASAAPDSQQKH